MRLTAKVGFLCLAIAGCTSGTGTIPSSSIAGPGPKLVEPEKAAEIFVKACVETRPTFAGAKTALSAYPFTQSSASGTYYHNDENLSVKVVPGSCSLVFKTVIPVDEVVSRLARGSVATNPNLPRNIDVTSQAGSDGARYFRLGLQSEN